MIRAFFIFRKTRKVLRQTQALFHRKSNRLDIETQKTIQSCICELDSALRRRDLSCAKELSDKLKLFSEQYLVRTPFERARDFMFSVGFALLFAVVIRTMWLELYTIPTASMRPTLKESDVLLVSKTDFGINVPLQCKHFMFDPKNVKRGSTTVWSAGEMDIPDAMTRYFGIFPGKKILVKRLMGKPGDTLYFYGGKIYGIDEHGNELKDLRDPAWFDTLEHIPFMHFDGKVETSISRGGGVTALIKQMDIPIAKLTSNSFGIVSGEMLPQKGKNQLQNYGDFWGINNFAMARLLSQKELQLIHPQIAKNEKASSYYLELIHHPSVKETRVLRDEMGRIRPVLGLSFSIIPLTKDHIDRIASHMTTARFSVKNNKAYRLGLKKDHPFYSKHYPVLDGVPDGTYEIQNGKASKVYLFGYTKDLPLDHPLYNKDPQFVQTLYNLGIEFLDQYLPEKNNQLFPSRYAYFREGSLYLMGNPVLDKGDPVLDDFAKSEQERAIVATSAKPYFPFVDLGPPVTGEGKLDVELIRERGLTIPDKMYLMLGDNHAMSADSRLFGFVPEDNLKGSVSFILSPFGSRWGRPMQPSMDYTCFSNLFVWSSAFLISCAYFIIRKKKVKEQLPA